MPERCVAMWHFDEELGLPFFCKGFQLADALGAGGRDGGILVIDTPITALD